jgi:hypothetical protein
MKLTIVISKGEKFFIGAIKEIPAVLTREEQLKKQKKMY